MKTNYVSVKSAIREFLRNSGHQNDIDKSDILAWASDAASLISTDEQLLHKVAILTVHDYKVKLPDDFRSIIQAACDVENLKKATKIINEIVQFKDKQWGCDLEINVKCPKCHERHEQCTCSDYEDEKSIVLNIDRMWANAHPEHMMAYAKHFYAFGSNYNHNSLYHPGFRLMRANTASFNNLSHHISDCVNLNIDSEYSYTIELPNIVVNFKEGKILISYMAKITDEDGYLMIPDTPRAHDAVYRYVQEKMLYKKFLEDFSQGVRLAWQTSLQLKDTAISRARAELQTPEFDEFQTFVSKFIHKVLPVYKPELNLYRGSRNNFHGPNQTYNYNDKNHIYTNNNTSQLHRILR